MTASAAPRPRLVLTMGDPLSIGPELIARVLADPALLLTARFLVLGDRPAMEAGMQATGCRPDFRFAGAPGFADHPVFCAPFTWQGERAAPGGWTTESGRQSLLYVKEAVRLVQAGGADGIVTCAICKAAWKAAGGNWPGHTELLAELTGCPNEVMMLAGGGLRVALATIHDPLARVPSLLTTERLVKIARILDRDLRARFALAQPRIAVLGLNPHAGEEGHIGDEEGRIIAPAVEALQTQGIRASGPHPADTAFHRMLQGEFDVILAMYHDQGLAALKTLAFDSGVNITLGLPLIRTSVDHGTAFDLAGTGRANPASLANAIRTAAEMCAAAGIAQRR